MKWSKPLIKLKKITIALILSACFASCSSNPIKIWVLDQSKLIREQEHEVIDVGLLKEKYFCTDENGIKYILNRLSQDKIED